MLLLIGSTTAALTLVGMMLGQVAVGTEGLGVLLAAAVVMSLQRE